MAGCGCGDPQPTRWAQQQAQRGGVTPRQDAAQKPTTLAPTDPMAGTVWNGRRVPRGA